MRWMIAIAMLALGCAGGSGAGATAPDADDRFLGGALLGPAKPNAYGPGLHSDATGRPFEWRTQEGETVREDVRPNAYGPGIGMDVYGRPVHATPQ